MTEHKGHTLSPRIEITVPYPSDNESRAVRLGDRDSTDNTTAMDLRILFTFENNDGISWYSGQGT